MRYRVFNDVPTHWELCAVEDVCEINPSQIGPDYPYSVIEYIDISSVSPRRLESVQMLPLKAAPSRAKRIVQEGDTIISTVRPNRRSFLYIKGAKPNTVVSTGFAVIRPREIDSRYAHYVLTSDPFIEHLTANATGSAYPAVSPEIIAKTLIPLPPKDEQKRIGEILGALDDKIELNHRMNRTLEAIARAIFKSWFVDFEPFLDGEFVDSDLGLIPKGWEVKPFSDVVQINPKTPLAKGTTAPYVEMADLPTSGAQVVNWKYREFTGSGSRFMNGDVLLARITPCLENGKTALVDFLKSDEVGWGSTEFIVLRPSPPLSEIFLYCLARSEYFRAHAIQSMTGTSGRQRVQEEFLGHYKIILPPAALCDALFEKFDTITRPLFKQMKNNHEEYLNLKEIRDTLLSKLFSGEIQMTQTSFPS